MSKDQGNIFRTYPPCSLLSPCHLEADHRFGKRNKDERVVERGWEGFGESVEPQVPGRAFL